MRPLGVLFGAGALSSFWTPGAGGKAAHANYALQCSTCRHSPVHASHDVIVAIKKGTHGKPQMSPNTIILLNLNILQDPL